jgi:hypothetical protein
MTDTVSSSFHMTRHVVRVAAMWFAFSSLTYAIWQIPNWDGPVRPFVWIGMSMYWIQLPGILVHGPHGGYGDWRDPAIVIPVTSLFYATIHLAISVFRVARRPDFGAPAA